MSGFNSNNWKIIINNWKIIEINKLISKIEKIKHWDLVYLKIKKYKNKQMNHKENILKCFKLLINIVQAKDTNNCNFKIRQYTETIKAITNYNGEIRDIDDVSKILVDYGIKKPKKTLQKILEILNTGTLEVVEKNKNDPIVLAVTNLTKIYSIGIKKAIELYNKYGITDINSLREEFKSNPTIIHKKQTIGLIYYDDLLKKIPRNEMDDYKKTLLNISNIIDPTIKLSINGSYRRGCNTSGDIDVLITSNNKTSRKNFINYLKKNNIIVETLANGDKKFMGISILPGYNIHRHIDIIETTIEEYAFGVLYFTGSGGFNIIMRRHALKLGYTLNEYSLSDYKTKQNISSIEINNKINKLYFEEEKDIFDFLDMDYIQPSDRNTITFSKI